MLFRSGGGGTTAVGGGVENAFAALLWQQMQARQLASARKLSKAVSDFYHQQGDSLLANLSAQTIQHWIGARGKADPPPTDAATSAVHRLVSPQNVSDVLRVAATLRLNKAQTTRLLWAADKPSVDELFAVPSSDTGLARVLQTWQIDTPNNLPTPLTSYVGRDEETVTLAELVCPVLMPSTEESRHSKVLRLCCLIPFHSKSLIL